MATPFYGEKPEGAYFYAKDPTGRMEIIAWNPPPTGDALCRGVFGYGEKELVRRILDGEFDHILHRGEVDA